MSNSEHRERIIWMGNIDKSWNDTTIKSFFIDENEEKINGIVDNILSITIKCNARKGWKGLSGEKVGFCLIEFSTSELVQRVITQFDGNVIKGTNIKFNLKPHKYTTCQDQVTSSNILDYIKCHEDLFAHFVTKYEFQLDCEKSNFPSLEEQLEPLTISQLRDRLKDFDTHSLEQEAQARGGRIAKVN